VAEDHPVRVLWEVTGRVELSAFYRAVRRWKGRRAGMRPIRA
jgi:hypothetical protein